MKLEIKHVDQEQTSDVDSVNLPRHMSYRTQSKLRRLLKGKIKLRNGEETLEIKDGMSVMENLREALVKEYLESVEGVRVDKITGSVADELFNYYFPQIQGEALQKKTRKEE